MTSCTCDSVPATSVERSGTERPQMDMFSAALHVELGVHYWLGGRWDLTAHSFSLAQELSADRDDPIVAAATSLLSIGIGDLDEADRRLQTVLAATARSEWEPFFEALLIAQVARLHAEGSGTQRAALLAHIRARHSRVPVLAPQSGAPVLLHYALTAIWANDSRTARALITRLTSLSATVSWACGVAAWLHGLLAEAEGDLHAALGQLALAVRIGSMADLPLYRAHALVDHARVAAKLGAAIRSRQSRSQARDCYARLGAAGYLRQLDGRPEREPGWRHLTALSCREREVLTLVVNGLSYAQIGRDLFISASTVGYHLSNIYAKTGVNSRHELTESVRRDPTRLGLTA